MPAVSFSTRPPAALRESDDVLLATYCRDLSVGSRPLDPAAEARLARDIEEADRRVWRELLGYPPLTAELAARVAAAFEKPPAGLKGLGRARSKKAAAEALAAVAFELRDADRERTVIRAVLAELEARDDAPGGRERFRRWLDSMRAARADAEAKRQEFVRRNLRLVLQVARRYRNSSMPFPDLVQEGNLGLIQAVDRYEVDRGFRFSTYATWWIRHAMRRAIDDRGRLVRQPAYRRAARSRIFAARELLTARHGRTPSVRELAHATGLSPARVELAMRPAFERGVSLDAPHGGDEERSLHEELVDPTALEQSPPEVLEKRARTDQLGKAIAKLRPIEQMVVRSRFGLEGEGVERSLADIGREHGLSRERIRQIEAVALQKLRRAVEKAEK